MKQNSLLIICAIIAIIAVLILVLSFTNISGRAAYTQTVLTKPLITTADDFFCDGDTYIGKDDAGNPLCMDDAGRIKHVSLRGKGYYS